MSKLLPPIVSPPPPPIDTGTIPVFRTTVTDPMPKEGAPPWLWLVLAGAVVLQLRK